MFAESDQVQVMHGQRPAPLSREKIAGYLQAVRGVIGNCVQAMPTPGAFIACAITQPETA